jgi:hypothetical protein
MRRRGKGCDLQGVFGGDYWTEGEIGSRRGGRRRQRASVEASASVRCSGWWRVWPLRLAVFAESSRLAVDAVGSVRSSTEGGNRDLGWKVESRRALAWIRLQKSPLRGLGAPGRPQRAGNVDRRNRADALFVVRDITLVYLILCMCILPPRMWTCIRCSCTTVYASWTCITHSTVVEYSKTALPPTLLLTPARGQKRQICLAGGASRGNGVVLASGFDAREEKVITYLVE